MQTITRTVLVSFTLPQTRRNIHLLVQRPLLRVLVWWGAALIALAVYASLRGKMDNVGFPVRGAGFETGLFGSLPTLWLQRHIFTIWPTEMEWASVVIHASWFFVPVLAAIFVSWRRPDRIGSLFRWWIALQALGLVLFALFPTAPPWMANSDVTRVVAIRFGGHIDDPNPLAAMPSLHVAFPLIISLWFFRERWKAPAFAMLAYSAMIAFEVVFSGEHYVVDVLGSCATVGIIFLAARIDYAAAFRTFSRAPADGVVAAARRIHERQRGQTLIEFALALPIILVFLLVMVDFGLLLDHRIVLQHAMSEGVREASITGGSSASALTDIRTTVADQSQSLVSSSDVHVCYINVTGTSDPGEVGDKVQVSLNPPYTYNFTAGGGELLKVFKVSPPVITMDPVYTTALQAPVTGATAC
jgi:Flp pilus assembly protein TadG